MTQSLIRKQNRFAEYYNSQENYDLLYSYSKKGFKLKKLYDLIFSDRNIQLAFRNIKFNKGSQTPGVDEISLRNIKKLPINKVLAKLKDLARNYLPSKVRRV
jgi:RNA-directed DNA polymerase